MGWLSLLDSFSKGFTKIFTWVTDEDGLAELQKRMKGARLEREAKELWLQYKYTRDPKDFQRYESKHKELVDFSNAL